MTCIICNMFFMQHKHYDQTHNKSFIVQYFQKFSECQIPNSLYEAIGPYSYTKKIFTFL